MRTLRPLAIMSLWIAVCAYVTTMPASSDETTSDTTIAFVALSTESEALSGVDVTAFLTDGRERVLGRTDNLGLLRVSREELGDDVKVLLFCREGFFCGALRTGDSGFLEYREHLIALAPFMVR